jgi:hypothetical protein
MIRGSTVYVYERTGSDKDKIVIYPWDVAAIFYRLKVDATLIDDDGRLVDMDKGILGVSDWI